MNWFTGRKRPARSLPKGATGTMREFVYLDDVAVTSLVSSLLGSVTESSTESMSREILAEIASSQEAKVPGFYQGSVTGKVGGTSSTGGSIQRKANIQATFAELERELRPRYCLQVGAPAPGFETRDERRLVEQAVEARLAVPTEDLTRGTPFEIEVELDLDESYSILALIETFNSFAREGDLIGAHAVEAFRPAQSVGRLLRMMMEGLVPLVCPVPSLAVVAWQGGEYVMPRELADRLTADSVQPELHLVAICQESLFWKDIRRVAFERGRYKLTGRIARAGLQTSWTPIKMSDVIRRYAPQVAIEFDKLPGAMSEAIHSSMASAGGSPNHMPRALLAFATALADAHSKRLDDSSITWLLQLPEPGQTYDSPDDWRPVFTRAADHLSQQWQVTFSAEELLSARAVMLELPDAAPSPAPTKKGSSGDLYLEADVIAIHW